MSDSAYDELARDRLSVLLDRSPELAKALYGMTRQFVRLLDEWGRAPEAVTFRPVHLDGQGTLTVRFNLHRSARAKMPFRAPWSHDSGASWVHGARALEGQFLRRCPSWRSAIVEVYDKTVRLAGDTGARFEDLSFGTGRIQPTLERAWLRVFRSPLEKAAATYLGV